MRVLIADVDLFGSVGGGQTVYRRLIELHPSITFHYLVRDEPADAARPRNAHPIPWRETYPLAGNREFLELTPPPWAYQRFVEAMNVAASVAGRAFDVVEWPDYRPIGMFLAPALRLHGVSWRRLVLAMHGAISTSEALNWEGDGRLNLSTDVMEQLQYRAADVRYAISRTYADDWAELTGFPAHHVDPLSFMDIPALARAVPCPTPPALNFIGRTERLKGPDLFLDLLTWVPRGAYSSATLIGPEHRLADGSGSSAILRAMARRRSLDVTLREAMPRDELRAEFARRSVTVLPSRHDTLNLVALESLLSGCPTAIGDGAGVCRYLRESLPSIPFLELDLGDVQGCATALTDLLQEYDGHRERLASAVRAAEIGRAPPALAAIYEAAPAADEPARRTAEAWFRSLAVHQRGAGQRRRSRLHRAGVALSSAMTKLAPPFEGPPALRGQEEVARELARLEHMVLHHRERTEQDVEDKLALLWKICAASQVARVRAWREIARLERMRGNRLLAATYELRVMRSQGRDLFGDLPLTTATLEELGHPLEARAARAMYSPERRGPEAEEAILRERYDALRAAPRGEFELIDDRRGTKRFRASIIVSLYDAADKLPHFLRLLSRQTMIRRGDAEVILVDSGSPGDEYRVWKELELARSLPTLYARTRDRETIQAAWNRGILLSTSPYLAFLGVDEAIVPECLDVLALVLDADPGLDWVIGNSVVTSVTASGALDRDVMEYDRSGYRQDLVYLETAYLSWVGALYRRSIHDRFGYYDPSFRAAGDTEFKGRLLPHLRSRALPVNLGFFMNYPDERTTQSTRAEIEDLRAWYLHRSGGGVRYAFAQRSDEEVEQLMRAALGYRKSYLSRPSSDVEYACALGELLRERGSAAPLAAHLGALRELLASYRLLDVPEGRGPLGPLRAIETAWQRARHVDAQLRSAAAAAPCLEVLNDNRHEQHAGIWKSEAGQYPNRAGLRHRWA